MLLAAPLTDSCAGPLSTGSHVCIGVSPFNSYFSVDRIAAIARWAQRSFDAFHFFVPDGASVHTLEALGYPPNRARYKAGRQGQYVINKIHRALDEVGVADPTGYVLSSAALDGDPAYLALLDRVHAEFDDNPAFAHECLEASRWVLDRRLPDGEEPTPDQLAIAVRYFLAELPMFLDTVSIAKVESSVFAYHQRVHFLELLYRQELSLTPHPRQGFVVLSHDEASTPDGGTFA
ncbi:tRNA-dependent cyclodipeptide synthase [Streptoalloteichus hindustanus]|uniref:Cyclodipeptide synthase n=1 Tax=Streptoalloteichus hindustanus TaxID=2017 RepID=A0A1M5MSF0_STRHI|nr:tRNA-dependent cyclodipeptide synthase [Streptoalloteichus hindustanus]SHG79992.1 cyclo(L-tyrosyl-L-tyrosyl) synthase [Streptoalloteichus hindustanus]